MDFKYSFSLGISQYYKLEHAFLRNAELPTGIILREQFDVDSWHTQPLATWLYDSWSRNKTRKEYGSS